MVGVVAQRAPWLPERLTIRDTLALMSAVLIAAPVQVAAQSALPTGGTVTHGSATIGAPTGTALTIDQSSAAAIIDWGSFSVGQPNSVQFNNGAGATLNRVIGADPSQINGALGATGSLYLINENGITVGPTGRIQTGGNFVGSTRDIANEDFLNGGASTFAGSSTGDIVNQGTIASLGGDVVLIARQVTNSGDISAAGGTAALGAGNEVLLNDVAAADGLMFVKLPNADAGVSHDGTITAASAELRANGGNVYTLAGNRSGEIHATGTHAEDGRIFLTADGGNVSIGARVDAARNGDGGDITIKGEFVSLGAPIDASGVNGGSVTVRAQNLSLPEAITATGTTGKSGLVDIDVAGDTLATSSGSIDVSGAQGGDVRLISREDLMSSADVRAVGTNGKGGNIDISGGAVRLFSPDIDASGTTGGGRIRIGGEYQGGKNLATDELPNAQALAVTDATTVRADATGPDGDGGTIIFWADQRAAVLADITARPGSGSGKGGFVEVSSAGELKFAGTASTGIGERKGTVLLDPKNIVVANAIDQSVFILGAGYGFAGFSPVINDAALESSDDFGSASSLDGTRLAVGAPGNDGVGGALGAKRGAVYLFNFTDSAFSGGQLAGVIGSGYAGGNNIDLNADGAPTPLEDGDSFGNSVSLDGRRLAIGAPGDGGTGGATGADRGAVYLFSFADDAFAGGALSGVIGSGYTGGNSIDLSAALDDGDNFGRSVSLDGRRLAVGASRDDGAAGKTSPGAAYLFTFTDDAFAGGAVAGVIGLGYEGGNNINLNTIGSVAPLRGLDLFGVSVSLDGARLAVGARGNDGADDQGSNQGAVYLFSFADEAFTGGTLAGVIGSGYVGGNNINLNAAGSTTPLDEVDAFGQSVSLDGQRLAVGAGGDDGPGSSGRDNFGAVYLFTFADDAFTGGTLAGVIGSGYTADDSVDLTAEGAAASLNNGAALGTSVSLDGRRLVAGASGGRGVGSSAGIRGGAAYLFSFTDDAFGGGTVTGVIGAGYAGGNNINLNAGGAAAPLENNDGFGQAVSLDGTRLAVSSTADVGAGSALGVNRGAVYLFNFADDAFSGGQLAGIVGSGYAGGNNIDLNADGSATPLDDADLFGGSVSLDGRRLAVGATGDDGTADATGVGRGAVYLFNFADDAFGGGALAGVVGSGYAGGNNVDLNADGSVMPLDDSDFFGRSVSLDGRRLAVGATGDDGTADATGNTRGAVYLFTFTDDSFAGGIVAGVIGSGYAGGNNVDLNVGGSATPLDNSDVFGRSVSLDGRRLAVGATGDDGTADATGNSRGAVYLLSFTDDAFAGGTVVGVIGSGYAGGNNVDLNADGSTTPLDDFDSFGAAVSLDGTRLAAGASSDDGTGDATGNGRGAVYLFTFADDALTGGTLAGVIGSGYEGGNSINLNADGSVTPLDDDDRRSGDTFGAAVSLDGSRLAVGAPGDDGLENRARDTGAVYLFTGLFGTPVAPVADARFGTNPGSDATITPASLTALLNGGNNVLLQANNNIFFNAAVSANNPGGDGGNLSAHAGNSIFVNADITTDNGDLLFRANGDGVEGWVQEQRDDGTANIVVANGVNIDAGTGAINWTLFSGSGDANAIAGDINFQGNNSVTASTVRLSNGGEDTERHSINFLRGTRITASGAGDAIVTSSKGFMNNSGADLFNLTRGGRFVVGASSNDAVARDGLVGGNFYGVDLAGADPLERVTAAGNRFVFADRPMVVVKANDQTREYGLDNPALTVSVTGLVNGDTLADVFGDGVELIGNTQANASSSVGTFRIFPGALRVGGIPAPGGPPGPRQGPVKLVSLIGYEIGRDTGTLSVTPAPLTVTANDEVRDEGAANPAFSATVTGLRAGDDASIVKGLGFGSNGAIASPAGNYFIRPLGGTATNYTLVRVDGVLTVVGANDGDERPVTPPRPDTQRPTAVVEREAIAASVRIVETPDRSTGFSIAGLFNGPAGPAGSGGSALGGLITASVEEGGGNQGASGTQGNQIAGRLVVEIEVEGDSSGPGNGAFSFQLPPDFTGCAGEGACDGVPDSVFFSNFEVAN